ncbi:unnamed protein product [Adineta steineri]|uniref:Uncharacterized protein n=1 Tax=Adineta steineri TaxID=433720 RepID=A0A815BX83_9BILA|nr:unnamed protein product [Adineta steineri]CAF1275832.1 unnamed protein product [Adineta steineri]
MATGISSNRCSICEKNAAMCNCIGCKAFFCMKHFNEHRQQLTIQFDVDVVEAHDKLLEQINQMEELKNTSSDLFSTIDQWESSTIEIVKRTADRARQQLTQLLDNEKEALRKQFDSLTQEIRRRREEDEFAENDLRQFRERINKLQQSLKQLAQPNNIDVIASQIGQVDWNRLIYVEKQKEKVLPRSAHTDIDAIWINNGITVAGGNKQGNGLNQLNSPQGICVDNEDQSIYITDWCNHRIIKWKSNEKNGQVVAGGNGQGNQMNQLSNPLDIIIDKESDNLIICDSGNHRVMLWSCRNASTGRVIISNIDCRGLALDTNGFLYVSDHKKNEVRRWRIGESEGIVVAGGNEKGNRLDQLNGPQGVFVDRDHSVYVSDMNNYRVMKWMEGAKEGIVVAGGQGKGNNPTQLSSPYGVIVDQSDTVYIVDCGNHQIVRWPNGAIEGNVVVGGNGCGDKTNQLNYPVGFSFDQFGNLYVSDNGNHRIKKFNILSSTCQ